MADDRAIWQAKHDAAAKDAGGQGDHLEAAAKVADAADEAAGGELETTSVEAEDKPTKPAAKPNKK